MIRFSLSRWTTEGLRQRSKLRWKPLLLPLAVLPLLLVFMTVQNAVNIWTYPANVELSCAADSLLVMGAAQYNGVPSPAFARRLDRALELYRRGCAEQIIVTGGKQQGDNYNEGQSGVRYLHAQGVPRSALLAETHSKTSYENLYFSRKLIGDDRLLIVTDDMHAYRSQWLADYLGFEASVVPVATDAHRLPYGLRELVALTAYKLGFVR